MTDIASLALQINSQQADQAVAALKRLQSQALITQQATNNFSSQARQAFQAVQTGAVALRGGLGSIATSVRNATDSLFSMRHALEGLVAGLAVHEIISMADAYQLLSARVRLVTKDAADHDMVMTTLFKTAQETRVAYDGLVDTYVRVRQATLGIGLASEDALKFHKALSLAIQESGASAVEALYGLYDLTHALQVGTVQWQLLRRIMQQTPGVVQSLARGLKDLGVITKGTTDEVVKLTHAGKLSTDLWIRAQSADLPELQRRWKDFPITVAGAMTMLHNEIFRVIGEQNLQTKGTRSLALAIIDLRDVIAGPEFAQGLNTILTGLAKFATLMATLVTHWQTLSIWVGATLDELTAFAAHAPGLAMRLIPGIGPVAGMLGFGSGLDKDISDIEARARAKLDALDRQIETRRGIADAQAFRDAMIAESGGTRSQSFTLNTPDKELTAHQIESEQKKLAVMTLQNQAIQAQIAGNDTLYRQLTVEAEIDQAISKELRAQQPELASKIEAQIRLKAQLMEEIKLRAEERKLDDQALGNRVLASQLSSDDAVTRELQIQVKIRAQISDELRAQNPLIAQGIENQIRLEDELQRRLKQREQIIQQLGEVWSTVAGQMQSAFDNFIDTGIFHWKQFIATLLNELDKVLFKLAVIDPLTKALQGNAATGSSGLFGNIASMIFGGAGVGAMGGDPGIGIVANPDGTFTDLISTPVAKGGVFSHGSLLTAYGRGGIISSPTVFPMRRGMGLMGEAGPEAVMPLTRGPDGRLGIAGGGSQVINNVNIINNAGATVTKQETPNSNGGLDIDVMIDTSVAKSAAKSGSATNRVLSKNFGLQPVGVRR